MATEANTYIYDLMQEGETGLLKEAGSNAAKVMKNHANEGGIARQLLENRSIGQSDLFIRQDSIEPCTMIEISPRAPGAVEIPLETGPTTIKVNTTRLLVPLSRVASNRFYADSANLLSYSVDIVDVVRNEFSNAIVDVEDSKVFTGLRSATGEYITNAANLTGNNVAEDTLVSIRAKAVSGAANTAAGLAQERYNLTDAVGALWDDAATLDRRGIVTFQKAIASGNTGLRIDKTLMSDITELDIIGELDHDQTGGTYSEDMLFHGLTRNTFLGTPSLTTVKKNLIAENEILSLVKPTELGVFDVLNEVKFETLNDNSFEIGFWAHEFIGMGIGNVAGPAFYTAGGAAATSSWR